MSSSDFIREVYRTIRTLQNMIKERGYETVYEEADNKTLVELSQILLENNIDFTRIPEETYDENILSILHEIILLRSQGRTYNDLLNSLRSIMNRYIGGQVEEGETSETEHEALVEIQRRIEEIETNKYINTLEKLSQKIILGKPKGTEAAIAKLINKILSTDNALKKIILCKAAIDMLPEVEKLIPREYVEELEKYYMLAHILRNSTRFHDGINERVSITLPFTEEEFKQYIEPLLKTRPYIIKYNPLTIFEEKALKTNRDREKEYEFIREILYKGISFKSYYSFLTIVSCEADRVVNKIVSVILRNLRTVRYYLEKTLEREFR